MSLFDLTPTERRVILIIGGVLILSSLVQFLKPHLPVPPLYDYSEMDSIFESRSKLPPPDTKYSNPQSHENGNTGKDYSQVQEIPEPKSININHASQTEIEKLPRIGPVTAGRIIAYRDKNGPFKSKDDLLKVRGIGPKTLDLISPYISF